MNVSSSQRKAEQNVATYYDKTESRLGYQAVLGGTRHFGYYRRTDPPVPFGRALRRMEDELGKRLDLQSGARVLDAGCGVGDVAHWLARQFGLVVVGIDLLEANVAEAKRRIVERGDDGLINIQRMSYADLGTFGSASFDGVYTMETLVHAGDVERVLDNFCRVLKPGGRLVLFEYSHDPKNLMTRRQRQAFEYIAETAGMPAFDRFNHGVLEGLVKEAGFELASSEDFTARVTPMLFAFAVMGVIPYLLGQAFGRKSSVINSMSAVEFWKARKHYRYNVIVASKSLGPS